jgi:hypothetical protein
MEANSVQNTEPTFNQNVTKAVGRQRKMKLARTSKNQSRRSVIVSRVPDSELRLENDAWLLKHGISKKASRLRGIRTPPSTDEALVTLRHQYKMEKTGGPSHTSNFSDILNVLQD